MKNVNASLIYRNGEELKHIILLAGDKVKFGRDHTNDIRLALFPIQDVVFQLATTDISRQHFVISRLPEGYSIRDLDSTNGTSVNCIAVINKNSPLENDQIIDIGGVLDLKVEIQGKALWLHRMTNTPQESYLLFPGEITIGSGKDNTIVLSNPDVAEQHARIRYNDCKYSISRLDELAPLMINSIPVQEDECFLDHEFHITAGEADILFKLHR